MSIPKIIHQLYLSDNSTLDLPKDLLQNINSWGDTHPEFIHVVWSLNRLSGLLKDFHGLNVLECVKSCRFPAMQADLIRLALIYEYGGFWSDLKNIAMQEFLSLYVASNIPCLVDHPPSNRRPEPNGHLTNSFFGAPAKSKFIWCCLDKICKNVRRRVGNNVYEISGPVVFMDVIKQQKEKSDPVNFYLIRYYELWEKVLMRTSASYDKKQQHWSERQKKETLYL